MDILWPVLSSIVSGVAAKASGSVYEWLKDYFRESACSSPHNFQELLDDLRQRSAPNIRRLVEEWASNPMNGPLLSAAQREELIALLINFTRGGRTTRAGLGSSFARNEELVARLLANIQPCRQHGEPAGVGWDDWKLERFLGKGSFGEVWLGRNAGHPEPRAFKFFMDDAARE